MTEPDEVLGLRDLHPAIRCQDIFSPHDHAEICFVIPHSTAVDVVQARLSELLRLAAFLGRMRDDDDGDLEPPAQPLEFTQSPVQVRCLSVLPTPKMLDLVPRIDKYPAAPVARGRLLNRGFQPAEVEVFRLVHAL